MMTYLRSEADDFMAIARCSRSPCRRKRDAIEFLVAAMTLPRSNVVQAGDAACIRPGPGGWALISSANMRNSG